MERNYPSMVLKANLCLLVFLLTGSVFAASPSFSSFDTNDFTVVGSEIELNTNRFYAASNFLNTVGGSGGRLNAGSLTNVKAGAIVELWSGFYSTNNTISNAPAAFFGNTNAGNVEQFWHFPFSARLENASQAPLGANASVYAQSFAGGGSGLRELPINNELKAHLPLPGLVIEMTTYVDTVGTLTAYPAAHTNVVQIIEDLATNSIAAHWTNSGLPLIIFADTWQADHRSSGNITHNTSLFPNGMAFTAAYCHTNVKARVKFALDSYVDTENPRYPNTERDANIAGGGIFDYPFGTNPNGSSPLVPVITPDTVHRDINLFYDWGVDIFVAQDINPYVYNQGYANQISRMLNDAILYPLSSVYWAGFKNTFENKGMGLVILDDAPIFPSYAYEANGVFFNVWNPSAFTYNHGNEPTNSSGISWAVAHARAFNLFQVQAGSGATCRPWAWTPLNYKAATPFGNLHTNDIRNIFAMAAVTHSTVAIAQPINYTNLAIVVTNAGLRRILADPSQHPPYLISDGATNSIWACQLENRIQKAVLLANESSTASTNLTLTAAMLGWTNNSVFRLTDVWSGALIGDYTNTTTQTVTATNALFYVATLLEDTAFNSFAIRTNAIWTFTDRLIVSLNGSNSLYGLPSGQWRINTANGAGVWGSAGLEVRETGTGVGDVPFIFENANGSGYAIDRDTSTGMAQLKGNQAKQFSGLSIYSDSSFSATGNELFRLSGGAYQQTTNAIGDWPTAAATPGGFAIVNSNSIPHMLISGPGSTTWTLTNRMVP